MKTAPSISKQTRQYFLQESADLLQTIDRELQTISANFSLQKVQALMRATHTLKGAAASVGLDNLVKATHSLEDVFSALCYDDTVVSQEMERLLFEGYECLQQLASAQPPTGSKCDNPTDRMAAVVTLDRLAIVVTRLQDVLGDRFGQKGHVPAAAELGFDVTRSIFEMGVAQRIRTLSAALETVEAKQPPLKQSDLDDLRETLKTQAEVFIDLAESLNLPGFEEIATLTLKALVQQPERVIGIATAALENFKAAQGQVLGGDRTSGGSPSAALKHFYDNAHPLSQKNPAIRSNRSNQAPTAINNSGSIFANSPDSTSQPSALGQFSWFKRQWRVLTQPIGEASSQAIAPSAIPSETSNNLDNPSEDILSNLDSMQWGELTPEEQDYLDVEPEDWDDPAEIAVDPQLHERDAPTPEPAPQTNATVRIKVEHLDQLSQAMGELLTQQNRQTLYNDQLSALVKKLLARISQQQQQLHQQKQQPLTSPISECLSASALNYNTFDALELDRYSDVQRLAQSVLEETVQQSESVEAIELFVRQSGQALEKQKRSLSNTREILLAARMVPLEKVFERFAPAVERLQARHPHKQINLVLKGGEVLVDRAIADQLYEPLLHLVRNAFDHGIELPDSRLARQKAVAGTITIEGLHQGRNLIVRVMDDGQGIDLDRVRRKAIETQRLSAARAAALTPQQTLALLFESGFSTKPIVDELSGRGVGLEAVREQVRQIQGRVSVRSEAHSGSAFTLNIPASRTIANLLLCQVKGRVYALIADAVEHILIPSEGQVRVWEGGKMLTWKAKEAEHLIPISELAKVLNHTSVESSDRALHHRLAPAPNTLRNSFGSGLGGGSGFGSSLNCESNGRSRGYAPMPVVLLRDQNKLVGIEVDRVLGEQELVISSLSKTVAPPDYLYGSSLLPDGQLTLVLDGTTLAKRVSTLRHRRGFNLMPLPSNPAQPTANARPVFLKKLILTVDDSITVRNTLSEALQRNNYQVIQAQDGAEALQQLERYPEVEAILCDIEMPSMNGFEFLKARARSPRIAAIPTIMLTSRNGIKHRLLSQELGATGYLTKPYLIPHLLKTVSEALAQKAYQPLSVVGDPHE